MFVSSSGHHCAALGIAAVKLVCCDGGTCLSVSGANFWTEHHHEYMHGGHAGTPVSIRT